MARMDAVSSAPMGQRLTVYCGSQRGEHPSYARAAEQLGRSMGRRGVGLVYGAADFGLMGVVADAVLAESGEVIGVIPDHLIDADGAHPGLSRLERVPTMHRRKQRMMELADGLIALPGGFGTFEELFEALTWAQLGLHQKPVALLNVHGYFDGLIQFLDHAVQAGFLSSSNRALLHVASDPQDLLNAVLR